MLILFLTFYIYPVKSPIMRVIIFSLPIPDIYNNYDKGNHQLFCEYIQALIRVRNIDNIEIIKLSRDIIDRYNNKKIVEEILKLNPRVVCFSSYVWNIERNIEISKMLRNSGIITITGGPDIQLDNEYIFNIDPFDHYVIGEGELVLIDILMNIKNNLKNDKIIYGKSVNFNEFLLEYSNITNQYTFDKLSYIEIERGCRFRCNYCAYGKKRDFQTEIDINIFKNILDKFYKEKDIEEIYLLSPTLNGNKTLFKNILDNMIYFKNKYNSNIKVFGELRPELIEKGDIPLLKNAGFKTIEIGIQSLNKNVIKNINREEKNFSLKDLSNLLLENEIDLIIDFIIGLPSDNFSDIIETIEKLDKYNILQYCNFYRLQILPSTEIKKVFNKNNFIYQNRPPYFAIETNKLSYKEIQEIYLYLEDKKDISYIEEFTISKNEQFFILKTEYDLDHFLNNNYFYHSGSIIFIDNFTFDKIYDFFNSFFSNNNEVFHHCYIYSKNKIDKNILNRLKNLFYSYHNYYDRYNEAQNFLQDPISKKLTILVDFSFSIDYIKYLYDDYDVDFLIFKENEYNAIKNIAIELDMDIFELKDNILIKINQL